MNATTQTPRRFQQGLQRLLQSRVAGVLSYPHGVDRYLEVLNPLWSTTEVRARVEKIEHLTADSVTVTLQPNTNWQGFIPGQFALTASATPVVTLRPTPCIAPMAALS